MCGQVGLIASLREVFDQVDVNGDQRMEWEELTSFIVEAQHAGMHLQYAHARAPTLDSNARAPTMD